MTVRWSPGPSRSSGWPCPEADDLLAGLLQVAEATRTVLEVDGVGLTLVHADGPPRWVAATDAAMELLVQVQHDFGEGPTCRPMPRTRRR